MNLKAEEILGAYRGSKLLEEDKIKKINKGFQDREFIMLRPGERLKFGTGVTNNTGETAILHPVKSITDEKGLLMSSNNLLVKAGEEYVITLHNPTKFLIEIKKGEVIATVTLDI